MFDWIAIFIVATIVGRLTEDIWYVIAVCAVMGIYGFKQYMEGYIKYSNKMREALMWGILKR